MKCIKIIFFLFLKLIYQNNLKQKKKINQKNFELLRNAVWAAFLNKVLVI